MSPIQIINRCPMNLQNSKYTCNYSQFIMLPTYCEHIANIVSAKSVDYTNNVMYFLVPITRSKIEFKNWKINGIGTHCGVYNSWSVKPLSGKCVCSLLLIIMITPILQSNHPLQPPHLLLSDPCCVDDVSSSVVYHRAVKKADDRPLIIMSIARGLPVS